MVQVSSEGVAQARPWLPRLSQWADGFGPLTLGGLGLFRLFFASWRLVFDLPTVGWASNLPNAFYDPPPSLAALLSGFPPAPVLHGLDVLALVLMVCILCGYHTKLSSILFVVTHLALNHVRFSFGKVDHDIVLLLLPLVMAFSGWGERYSLDERRRAQSPHRVSPESVSRWPVPVMAALVAFGFFTAGVPKAVGWIDLDLTTSGVRGWALRGLYLNERDALLLPSFAHLDAPLLWEFLDYLGVVFELAFLVLLPRPRRFRRWLAVACLFHAMNIFLLNISYVTLLPVYALLLNWKAIDGSLARFARGLRRLTSSYATFAVALCVCLVVFGWMQVDNQGDAHLGLIDATPLGSGVARLLLDAVLFVLLGVLLARVSRRPHHRGELETLAKQTATSRTPRSGGTPAQCKPAVLQRCRDS